MAMTITAALRTPRSIAHAMQALQTAQPVLLGARTLATGRASVVAADADGESSSSPETATQRKPRDASSQHFNLLSPAGSTGAADAAMGSKGNSNGKGKKSNPQQEWRHRPAHYSAHRPNNQKWWRQMDRESFRKLLDECMAVGKISSVLRKYMDEFPILDNKWSDQELVLITGALIKMNRSAVALDVLRNQIHEPDRNRLNRVAAESARLGNAQVALGILDIAKHFRIAPDVITYTSAIHACARGDRSDVPTALQLLNEMIQDGVTPNHRTYGAAVLAYARMNRWEEIEELMDAIPYTDDGNKSDVFAAAIITCTRNRQYVFATRLFTMLLDQGIYPGDNLCNAALSACARTSDLHHLTVIFRLVEKHATPTIYTFNSMISAYGNARDVDEAMRVYEAMQARNVKPDVVTFNALLLSAVRSRQVARVPHILALMRDEGAKWDVYTLNMLLESCALTGDVAQAEQYWAIAAAKPGRIAASDGDSAEQQQQQQQSVRLDRAHFEALMSVYFAAGAFDKVVAAWREHYVCRRRAKTSKTLNFLLRACKELRDDATAIELLDEFKGRGHVVASVSHNHLLATFLAAGKYDKARAYLVDMEREGLATTFSFTLLMQHQLDAGAAAGDSPTTSDAAATHDVLELFRMYMEARDRHAKWHAPLLHFPTDALYVIAARAAQRVASHDDLVDIYSECPATMSMAVKTEIARRVLASCEHESDWKTAVLLYDELTSTLDAATNVAFYEQVVKIVARAGEFEQALDVNGGDWYRLNRTDKGWGF